MYSSQGFANARRPSSTAKALMVMAFFALTLVLSQSVFGHGVALGDQGYIHEMSGPKVWPFMYLGAKHMVTGYDHLLFLAGVIFFLYRARDIALYVSLFAIGHSLTLILGVYFRIPANAYLIDAIIGLSVVYKALDNMGMFQRWLGVQPNTKIATFVFGLFHGFGLATKMQEFELDAWGLLYNLIAFNIGVELGQLIALLFILIAISWWRKHPSYLTHAFATNALLMAAGVWLTGMQLLGYFGFGHH